MNKRYFFTMGCMVFLVVGAWTSWAAEAGPVKMVSSEEPVPGGAAALAGGIDVARLGIRVEPDTEQGRRGLRITALRPQSMAERAGLSLGDLLLEINRVPLNIAQDIDRAIIARPGRPQVIAFLHDGNPGLVAIDLP